MSKPQRTPIIHMKDKQWYFWDETWTYEHGPYNTELECQTALRDYCKKLG